MTTRVGIAFIIIFGTTFSRFCLKFEVAHRSTNEHTHVQTGLHICNIQMRYCPNVSRISAISFRDVRLLSASATAAPGEDLLGCSVNTAASIIPLRRPKIVQVFDGLSMCGVVRPAPMCPLARRCVWAEIAATDSLQRRQHGQLHQLLPALISHSQGWPPELGSFLL